MCEGIAWSCGGARPGTAEIQALAREGPMNFFLALLSPSRAGVFLGMA